MGSPEVTQEERKEFLFHDALGKSISDDNLIKQGKVRHGQCGAILRDSFSDPWFMGWDIAEDFALNHPYGLRPLIEWFGEGTVAQWMIWAVANREGGDAT